MSPTTRQTAGHLSCSDDDIKASLSDEENVVPFPVELLIIVRQITKLRVETASNTLPTFAVQRQVQRLLQQIDNFDPDSWGEELEPYAGGTASSIQLFYLTSAPLIGHIHQIATRLYLIAALRASIGALPLMATGRNAAAAASGPNVCARMWRLQRNKLVQLLKHIWLSPHTTNWEFTHWPLLVAGAVLSGGPLEEQELVANCLYELWRRQDISSDHTILLALEKLRRFWKSGKRGWDDCFDEPVPYF